MRSRAGSQLGARGYCVLPEPQRVQLATADVEVNAGWHVVTGGGLNADDDLIAVLQDYLKERHGISLGPADGPAPDQSVVLTLGSEAVEVDGATDRDRSGLAAQGYELRVEPDRVLVSAAERVGLFYGISTLVQLITSDHGKLWLPEGVIVDWPDVGRRHVFWDDSEHLDRLETLKSAVRQAAMYKVNGFVLKLDSHFMYGSAPTIVDPHALAPEHLQELTDYARRFHVQVIPYVDAPGHLAWVLKHPEYARLRELANCNYELCTTDPDSYRLLEGLFGDLLAANQGVEHFVLSTDEPYYIGMGRSQARAAELGSVGKLEAEFISRAADYLRAHGRTVQIWGEYPIERDDIPSLPSYVINGITNGPKYDSVYARSGIRQLLYVATQAELQNFPDYYPAASADMVNPVESTCAVSRLYEDLSFHPARRQDNIVGVFVAAWADAGLHPETFWLGFICAAAWAWHPGSPEPDEAVARFCRLFYGKDVLGMPSVYESMSVQAQFFESSWDRCDSTSRTPIFAGPYEVFDFPRPARDQCLPLPDLPDGTVSKRGTQWRRSNLRRLQLARTFSVANDALIIQLLDNRGRARHNRHNLDVFSSIASLFAQNLRLLQDLGRIDDELRRAEDYANDGSAADAVACLDLALDLAHSIRRDRNETLRRLLDVWSVSMHLKTQSANGRKRLHIFDDVKDHVPDRTADMSYLILRQLLLPLDEWFDHLREVRNGLANANHLPPRLDSLSWAEYLPHGARD